ncbi:MAG: linear amide C-N hydrolase [Deltaproteobacteria bacterium]|nr:linear amide C-N hydrolase [Deltaproteobacteria bacterium]
MARRLLLTALCAALINVTLIPAQTARCTTFSINREGAHVVGKNFDFLVGDAMLTVNKHGVAKTGIPGPQQPFSPPGWTSRYGSITFNPWGREFPFSGINEAGLVISAMGLRKTEYPPCGNGPAVFMAQWVQYHLDRYATVKEVMKSAAEIRTCPPLDVTGGLHYLACDASGACAAIEYLDGRPVFHTAADLPQKLLTNSPYDECLRHLNRRTMPGYDNLRSIERFKTAADMLKRYDPRKTTSAVDYAFSILDAVKFGDYDEVDGVRIRSLIASEWSIVYDISNRQINFHTFDDRAIRQVPLAAFDFSCSNPVKVLDIQRKLRGNVADKFIDYNAQHNRNFLEKVAKILPRISDNMTEGVERMARYPDETKCREDGE